ncbi:MAG: aspartate aminotransferase family protein [Bacteroidales bacterium]|nr:aspartate aminotransferase family protein [Bacteroidales bacterium]
MISQRQFFLQNIAQTSPEPLQLEIKKAKGIYLYGVDGKKYIDLIAGVSVSNVGHGNRKVLNAVRKQIAKYMHTHVYGEFVLSPQVKYAHLLDKLLPDSLSSTYFVNSGTEAIEGAMKLAKKFTGRTEIISFRNAYHGSTHGALSIQGSETYKMAFRPLLPDTQFLAFNNIDDLQKITERTAGVVVEPIQGEAGIILPENDFLKHLRERCDETETLLIFDEIQTGLGRTGKLFGFENFGVVPDILTLAKAFGGGMPLGAFISSKKIMDSMKDNPALGHITTFGGHPVSCAAGLTALNIVLEKNLSETSLPKEQLFRSLLINPAIREIRGKGLFLAVELGDTEVLMKFIFKALENGILTDWFLFNDTSFRITPPLTITEEEIRLSCQKILKTLDSIEK